jgi:hypothetical protein
MGDREHPEAGTSVDADGVTTNYLEAVHGPPVVLVHGSGPELIERSELHVVGRCGHWTQIEWAADFNALLVRFLTREAR